MRFWRTHFLQIPSIKGLSYIVGGCELRSAVSVTIPACATIDGFEVWDRDTGAERGNAPDEGTLPRPNPEPGSKEYNGGLRLLTPLPPVLPRPRPDRPTTTPTQPVPLVVTPPLLLPPSGVAVPGSSHAAPFEFLITPTGAIFLPNGRAIVPGTKFDEQALRSQLPGYEFEQAEEEGQAVWYVFAPPQRGWWRRRWDQHLSRPRYSESDRIDLGRRRRGRFRSSIHRDPASSGVSSRPARNVGEISHMSVSRHFPRP